MPDPTPATTTTTDATSTAPDAGASTVTTTTTVKPGHQTTEFYLTILVAFLGAFMTAGIVADGSMPIRIAGMILTGLTTLGYTASRATVKKAASTRPALTEGKVADMIAVHHSAVMKQMFDLLSTSKAA